MSPRVATLSLLLLLGGEPAAAASDRGALSVDTLTCETLERPLGIESPHPRLSWQLHATARAQRQSAYRILVASDAARLAAGRADLWDSGRVVSDRSVLVPLAGRVPGAGGRAFWQVRVWDGAGRPSAWSAPTWFEMGLLSEADWHGAAWIGLDRDDRIPSLRERPVKTERMAAPVMRASFVSPLLRRTFAVAQPVVRARAYLGAVGYGELFVNGRRVGDRVLDPAPTSYDHTVLYVPSDITTLLTPGENCLRLTLGNGFFGQNLAFNVPTLAYGPPRARCLVVLEYADGSVQRIVSDRAWRATDGPVVFDNVYAGETYDARRERDGCDRPGYDDSAWAPAVERPAPGGALTAQLLPPIRRIATLPPTRILARGDRWLVDFGQNLAGWVRLTLHEPAGAVVTIRTAEALTRDGAALDPDSTGGFATGVEQIDRYVCRGAPAETWEPRFTYHGFRFAELSGLSHAPDAASVAAVLVHSDVPRRGQFACSDERLNRIYATSLWTLVDNLHGLPEDCPHREKCGWLGDAHVTAETALFNYDVAGFDAKYLRDIADNLGHDSRPRDGVRPRVPTMIAPGRRTAGEATLDWGIAIELLPWYVYLYTGDLAPLRAHYGEIKDFVAYMLTFRDAHGIVRNGLGDWCPPRWDRVDNPGAMECDPVISANAYFYRGLKILEQAAPLLGDPDYGRWAGAEAERLGAAFNAAYLVPLPDSPLVWYGSQTATVMALDYGMAPPAQHAAIVAALRRDITERHGGHLSTGIHGERRLYSVLAAEGDPQLALAVLTIPTFPSKTYLLDCGLTTWPERQAEWGSGIPWTRSLNHPMHSGFAAFFHESVAGIAPDAGHPGFARVRMQPRLTGQLAWARGTHRSLFGPVTSEWRQTPAGLRWAISVPVNTAADVFVPAVAADAVTESGAPLAAAPGVTIVGFADGFLCLTVESGDYTFLSTSR